MIDLTADYSWASQRIPWAISILLQATGSLERLLRRTGWSPETRDRLTMLEGAGNALLCMARDCATAPDAPATEQAATVRTIGMIGMWCESLAEREPILLAESKAAAWIARHTASDGQAARWRESGQEALRAQDMRPGYPGEWINVLAADWSILKEGLPMSKHMSAKSIRAEFGPADVDGSYTAQFNGTRFELYWDDQDPNNEGWWLRYIQPDGYEDGYAIDGGIDEPDWADVARGVHAAMA